MNVIVVAIVLSLCGTTVAAGAEPSVHVIEEFVFENGETLEDMRVGYATHGVLNAARDNAILVTHEATGNRRSLDPFIGPGKAFDTEEYFVIAVDAIGGGASSSPADGLGPEFPRYTVRDMVHAQHALVVDGLDLDRLLAVAGPSMGAFQALEWGIHYPDFPRALVMIAPAAKSERHVDAILDAAGSAITLDPRYGDGKYALNPVEGIVLSGMITFPWLVTDAYLSNIRDETEWHDAMRSLGRRLAGQWDANSLLWRYRAVRDFDVSTPFDGDLAAALRRVEARTLIMPIMSDRFLGTQPARDLFGAIDDADYVEIASRLGHLGCCPTSETTAEHAFISQRIRAFLADLE